MMYTAEIANPTQQIIDDPQGDEREEQDVDHDGVNPRKGLFSCAHDACCCCALELLYESK